MNAPVFEGGCQCGAIRYRASAMPLTVTHCHCATCRRSAGAAFVTWATFPVGAFAILKGRPRAFQATTNAERTFCSDCGTSLTFRFLAVPQEIDVTVASLDDPETFRPEDHIWTEFGISWAQTEDGLPRYPRRRED